jgi:hypothetical protein
LDERVSYAAVGAVDQDGLAGCDLRLVHHLPGGDAVHHNGLGICGVDVIGNGDQVAGVDHGMGRPSSGLDYRGDAVADH